jgi:membrane protein
MFLIGYNFYHNKTPWNLDSITGRLQVPLGTGRDILALLVRQGLIVETGGEPPSYLPAKDLDTIALEEIIRAMRAVQDHMGAAMIPSGLNEEVERIISTVDDCIADALKSRNLKEVVLSARNVFPSD